MDKINLVIFDMDGLMFDTENLHFLGWQWAGEEMGISIKRELFVKTLGSPIKRVERIFKKEFGEEFDFLFLRALRVKLVEEYLSKNPMPKKKGLDELLFFLKENEIKTALATSTIKKEALPCLKWGGVEDAFTVFVFGDMVERGKPNPEIFLKAAELAGISKENALVLEDSPAGIAAAHSAGIKSIMVPDMMPPTKTEIKNAFAIAKDLLEVKDILSEMNE